MESALSNHKTSSWIHSKEVTGSNLSLGLGLVKLYEGVLAEYLKLQLIVFSGGSILHYDALWRIRAVNNKNMVQ